MVALDFARWLIIFVSNMFVGDSKKEITIAYPGTKWCGPGNASVSFYDLGVFYASDKCCRNHDLCPDFIGPKSTGHGLVNDYPFSRSCCDCDEEFRRCLHKVNTSFWDSMTAKTIGFIYFTLLADQCFEKGQTRTSKTNRRATNNSTSSNPVEYHWKRLPPF